jgi:hypothetical protein
MARAEIVLGGAGSPGDGKGVTDQVVISGVKPEVCIECDLTKGKLIKGSYVECVRRPSGAWWFNDLHSEKAKTEGDWKQIIKDEPCEPEVAVDDAR